MSNLEQTIRNAISCMFTVNLAEEVVSRVVRTIEREYKRSDCGDEEGACTVQEPL